MTERIIAQFKSVGDDLSWSDEAQALIDYHRKQRNEHAYCIHNGDMHYLYVDSARDMNGRNKF